MSNSLPSIMKQSLNKYLTVQQYDKIRKYWKIIKKLSYKVERFEYVRENYMTYEEHSDDEDTIYEPIIQNRHVDNYYETLRGQLKYFEEEYANYVNKIGFQFNDRLQDECLFNLLNNGIIID